MGIYATFDEWAALLEAAGVPVLTDSRGQFSSPAGYVLIEPNGVLTPRLAGGRGLWFMSGVLYAVVDGPWGTAAGRAIDALVARCAAVLGEHLARVEFPDVLSLAATGIDQPAAQLTYENVPVSIKEITP